MGFFSFLCCACNGSILANIIAQSQKFNQASIAVVLYPNSPIPKKMVGEYDGYGRLLSIISDTPSVSIDLSQPFRIFHEKCHQKILDDGKDPWDEQWGFAESDPLQGFFVSPQEVIQKINDFIVYSTID